MQLKSHIGVQWWNLPTVSECFSLSADAFSHTSHATVKHFSLERQTGHTTSTSKDMFQLKLGQQKCLCIIYRNLKGCPTTVKTHCYKGLLQPVLGCAWSVAWDPKQQNLKSTLKMVQWLSLVSLSACHILHYFNPSLSASAFVAQLLLKNLQSRRMSDKTKPAWCTKSRRDLSR